MLHGELLDLKCFDGCGYVERHNTSDPLCPALATAAEDYPPDQTMPLLDPNQPIPDIKVEDLPHCPGCKTGLLRPGVVWFGERLDEAMLREVDDWIDKDKFDLVLVIGTSAVVQPAAGFVDRAADQGATLAVFNPDPEAAAGLVDGDYFFQEDSAKILPLVIEGVTRGAASPS